jgi:hypothetical protein
LNEAFAVDLSVARSAGTLDAAPTTANPMFRLIFLLHKIPAKNNPAPKQGISFNVKK